MATKKKENIEKETVVETVEEEIEVVKEPAKEKAAPEPKVYREDDLIMCRSITRGELIYIGAKSRNRYSFSDHGDTCEVEVRDLNSLRAAKSQYLFSPLFVIEDEEFIEQPKWKDVKALYDEVKGNDVEMILDKPLTEFKRILVNLPIGYKKALASEAATRIHNEDFDSLGKIRAIDEFCGTDLYSLLVK